jgi:hypothetical protein
VIYEYYRLTDWSEDLDKEFRKRYSNRLRKQAQQFKKTEKFQELLNKFMRVHCGSC